MQPHTFILSFEKMRSQKFSVHTPDYLIMFNGVTTGRLCHRDFGYVGIIPDHTGHFHQFPEAPLQAWNVIRKRFMDEAEVAIQRASGDDRKIDGAYETLDPKIMRVSCGQDEKTVSANALFFAQKIFGHTQNVPWSFCAHQEPVVFTSDSPADNLASLLVNETKDETTRMFLFRIAQGDRPVLGVREWSTVEKTLSDLSQAAPTEIAASGFLYWFYSAYPECFRGILNRFLVEVQARNIWTNEKLCTAAEHKERAKLAYEVEEHVMHLREIREHDVWTQPAETLKPADLPFRTLSDIKFLFKTCSQMREASPLKKVDPELLSFFQEIADYDPVKKRNRILESLIHDAKKQL